MIKKIIPLLIALILLFGLIYFSDASRIYHTLIKTNLYFFLAAVGLWLVTHIIKVVRWKYLLSRNNVDITFASAFKVFTASGFVSNITPAKMGEPLKSFILKKNNGVKISKSIPSIFFERVFDIVSLIVLSLIAAFFLTRTVASVQYWFLVSIAVYAVLIVVALFVLISRKRTLYVFSRIYKVFSFLPKIRRFDKRFGSFVSNFHNSFIAYKSKRVYGFAFLLSLSIWIIEGIILFILFMSFGFDVTLASTIFIVPVATLVSVITFLPGGIGSSEIITVLFFSSLFGLTFTEVTSVAIVSRISTFWVSTFLGAAIFSKLKYKYKL